MATWTIKKSFEFSAGHHLPNHDGKCRKPHGHNYKLTVVLTSDGLDNVGSKEGMVLDFYDISAAVNPLLNEFLDHQNLNDTLECVPTAEKIAEWVYNKIKPKFNGMLEAVILSETSSCEVIYQE